MKAPPPLSHPDLVLPPSLSGLSFLSHVCTGPLDMLPFLGHAHDGMQQSQYRVVLHVDCAPASVAIRAGTSTANIWSGSILTMLLGGGGGAGGGGRGGGRARGA